MKSSSLDEKKLEGFGFGLFVGDGLCSFGRGHRTLGASTKNEFFDSSFYWKLDYNVSL